MATGGRPRGGAGRGGPKVAPIFLSASALALPPPPPPLPPCCGFWWVSLLVVGDEGKLALLPSLYMVVGVVVATRFWKLTREA